MLNIEDLNNFPRQKQFKSFLEYLINKEKPLKIILFGSLARGDYHLNSDIDLFIIYSEKITFKDKKRELLSHLKKNEKLFDLFPYHIHDFNALAINPNLFINNALKQSILLYERK